MPFDRHDHRADDPDPGGELDRAAGVQGPTDEAVLAGTPVVVRRHAGVAGLVGVAASVVAIAYLWRAVQTMAPLDWTLFAVMALVGGYFLVSLVDARTPLLVADDLGVRIRLGNEWRGLPWEAIGQVVVHPRRSVLRDGRLVLVPRSLARALEGLDARGRRNVALNQKMYGAALAVPLGLTTRVSTAPGSSLSGELAALTSGRAEVLELDPRTLEVVDPTAVVEAQAERPDPVEPGREPSAGTTPVPETVETVETAAGAETAAGNVRAEDSGPQDRPARRSILGGIGTIVSRVAKGRDHDVDTTDGNIGTADGAGTAHASDPSEETPAAAVAAVASPVPAALRETRPALRAEATLDLPSSGSTALDPAHATARATGLERAPEDRELRRPGSVDLVFEPVDSRVRPISTLGDPVEPLVVDDYVTEPAYDPVIGPELTAARTRLGLSVDDLAERTRIRPHVIESIEVDDFAPCGGDFYARGHLRTLARILGKDPEPLLAAFEERYATAPVNARRVFEAELATGMTGSMRSTVGGPNWSLLVGVVLALVLVWGVVRLFATDPVEMVEVPAPVLNGSAGVAHVHPVAPGGSAAVAKPVTIRLTASQADTEVLVRDGEGAVVYSGELVLGERKTLEVTPPVRVRAADGGAVEVRVAGRDKGPLGEPGKPARRTFRR